MKLGTGKMESLTCFFENIVWTHARVSYSFPGWMVFHLESVRLEKMSITLENLVEMMSPICFEIVAHFHKRLSYSFLTQIFLQWDVLEKDVGPKAHHSSFDDDQLM